MNLTENQMHYTLVMSLALLMAPLSAQLEPGPVPGDGAARRFAAGGDLDKIEWHRPFGKAQELARSAGRVMLIKPILGGGNAARADGVPCGGKNDCEGSW